ncbi:MAG: hypothetical protein WCK35_13630 [Chloroflexota bacterium]
MKKILSIVSAVVIAAVIFGAGFVFAQSNVVSAAGLPVGYGPGSMGGMGGGMSGGSGSQGQVMDYVEQALADKLGLTKADVEAQQAAGKSLYQIAIDKGILPADVTALLSGVHQAAFAQAVSAGILTQAQADLMLQNMSTNSFSGTPLQNGTGMRGGNRGGMRGGGGQAGLNQLPANTP